MLQNTLTSETKNIQHQCRYEHLCPILVICGKWQLNLATMHPFKTTPGRHNRGIIFTGLSNQTLESLSYADFSTLPGKIAVWLHHTNSKQHFIYIVNLKCSHGNKSFKKSYLFDSISMSTIFPSTFSIQIYCYDFVDFSKIPLCWSWSSLLFCCVL